MKTQFQFKIYSDLMSLAAELSQKRHKYKRSDTKKPAVAVLISKEIELRKINLMIDKLKTSRQRTPDEEELLKRLYSERQHTRKKVKQAQKDWMKTRQTNDQEALETLIRDNTTNKIDQELKKLNSKKQAGNPDRIVVYSKQYCNQDVLRGFKTLTRSRSRNNRNLMKDSYYDKLKDINDILRVIYKHDKTHIDPISQEVFTDLLQIMTRGKAEDINNCGMEHVLYAADKVQDKIRKTMNNMTMNGDEYSDVLFNIVIATMLYKGKNKKREDPMSYQRISIGSMFQKILDRYMAEETNEIAKKAQGTSHYGFSKDIIFLQLTVLWENVQKIAEETGKLMICLASDISDAFSQTTREAQMYECYKAGEKGKTWLYSNATYSNTFMVIKDNIKESDT